jgi:hypothetical protein
MQQPSRPEYADNANQHPKDIEDRVGIVFLEDRAPGKQHSVCRIENPYKHEWTLGSEPADEAEAENTHQYPGHLYSSKVPEYELINGSEAIG